MHDLAINKRLLAVVLPPHNPLFSFTRCSLTDVYRRWSPRTENDLQYFSRPGSCCRYHPQTRSALGGTMIRLLAAVLSLKNPFFHSVQTDWCYTDSGPPEPNIIYFPRPGSSYRCHPPNMFRSGRAQPPKRERFGFPANLRGARARRTRRQKGADCAPPPEDHPPDEHAEFLVPVP